MERKWFLTIENKQAEEQEPQIRPEFFLAKAAY